MPGGWEWDPTLFRGSAAYYERGRLPYAPGFADVLARALGLDGRGRLLDVGCGPGTVLLPMARYVTEAVGVDPDEDMLAEAERRARRRGVTNARWVAARAEDLPAGLGTFRAVVFAQSFHWTDRDRVAATVLRMLEPDGALVHVSDLHGPHPEPVPAPLPPPSAPAPPYDRIRELVRRCLGPVRRAGQGVLVDGTPGGEAAIIERAGFEDLTRLVVPAGQIVTRSRDDIVAWVFSRSDSAPHLFGDGLPDFERDLRTLLAATAPDDRFAERLPATEIRIWRKRERER
ncbi:class I SAM-dependent methyltransferase [Streptomyces caniscabiei]|uniref:class I SAM-dependent methyltransferase n=1 Tax=Streptomyces caniscabiei TaxID=2746961 RepID=UPI0007660F17|nr:class I SAM-dependent methyltransferase [Streptomyces caniscabiei]